MANKLKKIFSTAPIEMSGRINFSDPNKYNHFLAAIETANKEGHPVPIEGVKSIVLEGRNYDTVFPLARHENVSEVFIAPAIEEHQIPVSYNGKEKTITLTKQTIKKQIILQTDLSSVVFFKFVHLLGSSEIQVNCKINYLLAHSIEDLIEDLCYVPSFLSYIFKHDISSSSDNYKKLLSFFTSNISFFKRLIAVRDEFNLSISMENISNLSLQERTDIEELYFLICKQEPLRQNQSSESTNDETIQFSSGPAHDLRPGDSILLTYNFSLKYSLFGKNIKLFAAGIILNATVKEVVCGENTTSILYGGTDSSPMIRAFSAYKNEQEAEKQRRIIAQQKNRYASAKTLSEYLDEYTSI